MGVYMWGDSGEPHRPEMGHLILEQLPVTKESHPEAVCGQVTEISENGRSHVNMTPSKCPFSLCYLKGLERPRLPHQCVMHLLCFTQSKNLICFKYKLCVLQLVLYPHRERKKFCLCVVNIHLVQLHSIGADFVAGHVLGLWIPR